MGKGKRPNAAHTISHWSEKLNTQSYPVLSGANPIILGVIQCQTWLQSSVCPCGITKPNLTLSCTILQNNHAASRALTLSRAATAAQLCHNVQENMAVCSDQCFKKGAIKRVRGMDGWRTVSNNPSTPPPRGDAEQGITSPPPPVLHRQLSMARQRKNLRLFNYSPGEDDSGWMNSLEREDEEEEDKKHRRRIAEREKNHDYQSCLLWGICGVCRWVTGSGDRDWLSAVWVFPHTV